MTASLKKIFYSVCILCFIFCGTFLSTQEEELPYPPQALLNAAYMGDIELMERILKTNCDKDYRDPLGGTALHVAVFRDNTEAIRLLVRYGFDINAISRYHGYTPLHYCVWTNSVNSARLLVALNADRNIKDADGYTPLEKASREGKRDIAIILARR